MNLLASEWEYNSHFESNPTAFTCDKLHNGWYMCSCPFHCEATPPGFGINLDNYNYNCFACGAKGTIYELIAHSLDIDETEAESWVLDNTEDIKLKFKPWGVKEEIKYLSEEILERYKGNHEYMLNRGINLKTQDTYEVGYDKELQAITFPIRDTTGKLRMIQRRSVKDKKFFGEEGANKKTLYGLYYIYKSRKKFKEVYITESAIDAQSLYQTGKVAVSILGKKLYKEQITELVNYGFTTVNLFLDNDKYGRMGAAQAYKELIKYPIRVNKVIHDKNYKDANELLVAGKLKDIKLQNYLNYMLRRKRRR